MNALLEETVNDTDIHIQFLFKYVDDLLLCVHEDDIDNLFQIYNNKGNLGFTKEIENDNKIAFLDVEIIRTKDNNLEFKWKQRKTCSGRMINFYSCHPLSFKQNLLYNRTITALQRTNPKYFSEIKNEIRSIFKRNSYPHYIIEKEIRKAEKQIYYGRVKINKEEGKTYDFKFDINIFKFSDEFFVEDKKNDLKRKREEPDVEEHITAKRCKADLREQDKKQELKMANRLKRKRKSDESGKETVVKKPKTTQLKINDFFSKVIQKRDQKNNVVIEKKLRNKHLYKQKNSGTNSNIKNSKMEPTQYFSFNYNPLIANKIRYICKDIGKISWRYENKINNSFSNIKDKLKTKETKYNIYEISCADCTKVYIGESEQILSKRIKQHATNVDREENKTALANHAIENKHAFEFDKIKILGKEKNMKKRRIKENIHIIRNRKEVVNKKTEIRHLHNIFMTMFDKKLRKSR